MNNIPDTIFLQLTQEDIEEVKDFDELEEVTWCSHKINDTDIEYVRKQSPWISTEEAPTPLTGYYFKVQYKDGKVNYYVGVYNPDETWESGQYLFLSESPLYKVTHYMPIPK